MAVQLKCKCGTALKIGDDKLGKTIACPKCKRRIHLDNSSGKLKPKILPAKAGSAKPSTSNKKAPKATDTQKKRMKAIDAKKQDETLSSAKNALSGLYASSDPAKSKGKGKKKRSAKKSKADHLGDLGIEDVGNDDNFSLDDGGEAANRAQIEYEKDMHGRLIKMIVAVVVLAGICAVAYFTLNPQDSLEARKAASLELEEEYED